jgi:hypothetical protein
MTTEIKVGNEIRKKRTPRSSESILVGLLALPLAERVRIKNELQASIESEVKQKEQDLQEAKELVNGKQH